MATPLLRVVLGLTGLALAVIALNTALGGAGTLGWQFPSGTLTAADPLDAARHDNNARFFAGVFVALGLVIASGALRFSQMRSAIVVSLLATAIGGAFRLLQSGYSPVTDTQLLPSLIAELVAAPLLAYWVARS